MGTLFSCYGLFSPSTGRTYIGMTTDTHRRVRQHRGDLAGGARATRVARDWQMVFALTGFPSHRDALRAEWRLKHPQGHRRSRRPRGPQGLATSLCTCAHAAAYEPVLRLYEGMMRASVSCALYAALHAEYGQLPGLPQTCGIPQRIRCLNGKEARGLACGGGKAKSVALDKETLSGPIEALGVAVNELYARGAATFDAAYAEEQENTAANDVTAKARDRLRAELRLLDPLTIRARATQAGVTVEPDHDVEDITELIVRASVGGANATDAERRELRDGNARSSIRQEERAARRVAAALGHVFDRFAAAGCGGKNTSGCGAVRDVAARLQREV